VGSRLKREIWPHGYLEWPVVATPCRAMNRLARARHQVQGSGGQAGAHFKGASLQKWLLLTLLLATPAAAQDASLTESFAEGFTFHVPDASRRIDPDGAAVYAKSGSSNTQIAAVRQGATPCVFIATSLNLNEGVSGTPLVMLEETYDLRGVSFEADPKHQFAPPGGVYLSMTGPKIQCRISTGGSGGKLQRSSQCGDRFEATIEERMMPAFTATVAKLKSLCQWK
jgi:hypothetical protein